MIIALLLACAPMAGDSGDAEAADCGHEAAITWSGGGEGFFATNCWSCHSSTTQNRYGAPEYLNYDTYEGVKEAATNIRQAALWDQVMPPGYPLDEANRETLESFLDCGL